jgi:hypothetical protein
MPAGNNLMQQYEQIILCKIKLNLIMFHGYKARHILTYEEKINGTKEGNNNGGQLRNG